MSKEEGTGRGSWENGNGDVIRDWEASGKSPVLRTLTSVTDEETEVNCLISGHTIGDCGEGCSLEENSGF